MFGRDQRLRRHSDVQRTRARGKAWADGPLVLRVLANRTDPPQNRYTVIAGKKVGKAVRRNRAKRVVREALRLRDPDLRQGFDIVAIVRGQSDELPDLATAQATLDRILRRADLIAPKPDARSPESPAEATGERGSPDPSLSA